MNREKSILVVIVNYRTPRLVVDCLRSLEAEVKAHDGASVTVVDNASGDGSADLIAAAIEALGWSSWAQLVRAPVNGGFSYGNNLAISPALHGGLKPRYFWLLNPDTVVRPGALRALTDFMHEHPKVGICGSGIDEDGGQPWPYAFRFPSALGEFEAALKFGPVTRMLQRWAILQEMSSVPARVDWVSGCSMVVRREVFDAIGLMDEGYFLYYEETDFCLKAHRAGWECWFLPQARVIHISGQSTGVTGAQQAVKPRPQYWFDSRRRYLVKNHGRAYAALTDLMWLAGFPLWRLRRALQRKPDSDPPRLFRDFLRNSALLRLELPSSRAALADTSRTRGT